MWAEQYALSFYLFISSGLVLMVGVYLDDKRATSYCAEQDRQVRDYKSFADSWEVAE